MKPSALSDKKMDIAFITVSGTSLAMEAGEPTSQL